MKVELGYRCLYYYYYFYFFFFSFFFLLLKGSDNGSLTGPEDAVSERVRFDDHVSFIAPHRESHCVIDVDPCAANEKTCLRNVLLHSQLECSNKRFGKIRKNTPPNDQVDLPVIHDLPTSPTTLSVTPDEVL